MADLVFFEAYSEHVARARINYGADTFKAYFTNTAPDVSADSALADLPTELANGNGYTTGGLTVPMTLSRSGSTTKITATDTVLTASGAVGPFRYVCLYDSTTGYLIGYYDRGSSLSLASGETYTLDFNASTGLTTIAPAA